MAKDIKKGIKEKASSSVVVSRIEDAIKRINEKEETLYFFTIDSKGIPNGNVSYIYQLAKALHDFGYKVCMLYQLENEYTEDELDDLKKKGKPIDSSRVFSGVGSWMGEGYDKVLPKLNITTQEWKVSPSDFLFIPEVFSGLMFQTMKSHIPCKRYVILQDYKYVSKFIPMGVSWANYGVIDAIATTEEQVRKIHDVFPFVKCKILNPYIPNYFRKPLKAKKLVVNLCVKEQDDISRIVKSFYWKFPIYKFISFRDIRNFPRTKCAELMKEAAFTIWIDRDTAFGYQPLEAMRCGSIVIGMVPDNIPEWMRGKNGKLTEAGIWFDDIDNVPKILSAVIGAWMQDDKMLDGIYEGMEEISKGRYLKGSYDMELKNVIGAIEESRVKELKEIKAVANEKASKVKEGEE